MAHNPINQLLEHLMCQDIPTVYGKLHFWTFTKSIANSYQHYGRLSVKQINAIAYMIYKYTGIECKHYAIQRSRLYTRVAGIVEPVIIRVAVVHNFQRLEAINTHELAL